MSGARGSDARVLLAETLRIDTTATGALLIVLAAATIRPRQAR